MRLYDAKARRLYINAAERARFVEAASKAPLPIRAFAFTLLYSGCRLSEATALRFSAIQAERQIVTFRTLKRRSSTVFREVPVSADLIGLLMDLQDEQPVEKYIWSDGRKPINRSTGYRWIKQIMTSAGVVGKQASPKGLRHGYGIHAQSCGVPPNMLQKWMGHADLATTAIYADACGEEELEIAGRMW